MNKIPLSVVALAAVSVTASAADATQAAKDALAAQKAEATTEISKVVVQIDTYHAAVSAKYHALVSGVQDQLNADYENCVKDIEAGKDNVVLDVALYVDKAKAYLTQAQADEANYVAWDKLVAGELGTLKKTYNTIASSFTKANYPYSYDEQNTELASYKVPDLIDEVDNAEKNGQLSLDKIAAYTADCKARIAAAQKQLNAFRKNMAAKEETAKQKQLNDDAYAEVRTAIDAAKDVRNSTRDALVSLLPTAPYADWRDKALGELTDQVTALINKAEKSNEAANAEKTAATNKAANLALLEEAKQAASKLLGDYTAMKKAQEDALAVKNEEYGKSLAKFEEAKKVIDASHSTYLNADSTAIGNQLRSSKAAIDDAYKAHTVDKLTQTMDGINSLIGSLRNKANLARADYDAHVASSAKIEALQQALDEAIKEAKVKTDKGDYVAFDHFTATSTALSKAIDTERKAEKAAYSASDATKAGKAGDYAGKVDANLGKIKVDDYVARTDKAKADYTAATTTIEEALLALGELETKAGDKSVSITGEVYDSQSNRVPTYQEAINHFNTEIGNLQTALDKAVKTASETNHSKALAAAAASVVKAFNGQDMAQLTQSYEANKTAFEANVKEAAAGDILKEVNNQLEAAKKNLDNTIEDGADYGVKRSEIEAEKQQLEDIYKSTKAEYDKYSTWKADGKEAAEVIASLTKLNGDLEKLTSGAQQLKEKAESAKENKAAYDEASAWINSVFTAINVANSVVDNGANVLTDDLRGQSYFDNVTGVLSKLTARANALGKAVGDAYTAETQTVKDNLESYKSLKDQLVAEAKAVAVNASGTPSGDFIDNEYFHANHVTARDNALNTVKATYERISKDDETEKAKEYLAQLAQLQEQLNNMTEPTAKGIITEKLAAGLSKKDNAEVTAAINAIVDKCKEIGQTQLDGYKQAIIADNDAEHKAFVSNYNAAYATFSDAIKTLNEYAAISYNDEVTKIAQENLISTHDNIYAYASKLLEAKTSEQKDYDNSNSLEDPAFFHSDSYIKTVTAYAQEITDILNDYVKEVNAKAVTYICQQLLPEAKRRRDAAKAESIYKSFTYKGHEQAFKDVDDLIATVERSMEANTATATADPKFAVNLEKEGWINDLGDVSSWIRDDKEAAAANEYEYLVGEATTKYEAERKAIGALKNIDSTPWLIELGTSWEATVEVAKTQYEDLSKYWRYNNISPITTNLHSFLNSFSVTVDKQLHTDIYKRAYDANVAAGDNAKALDELNKLLTVALGDVETLAGWLNPLYVAHANPTTATITVFNKLSDNIEAVKEGLEDNRTSAVAYLANNKATLNHDNIQKQAASIKSSAIDEEISVMTPLIQSVEEKYNQLAKESLEEAKKFDQRIADAYAEVAAISKGWTETNADKKLSVEAAKARLLTLQSTIAVLDGELAKATNKAAVDEAHTAIVNQFNGTADNIAKAKEMAGTYAAVNGVFGDAIAELEADLNALKADEEAKYKAGTVIMYSDNFLNGDLKKINDRLDEVNTGKNGSEGLEKMHSRYSDNDRYYNNNERTLERYETELNRVSEAIADYQSHSESWDEEVAAIRKLITNEKVLLDNTHDAITVDDASTGLNRNYQIASERDIKDRTANLDKYAAASECNWFANRINDTYTDAEGIYQDVLNKVEGLRYNPTAADELRVSLDSLKDARDNAYNYIDNVYNRSQSNTDINGNGYGYWHSIQFMPAWRDEIHSKLTELLSVASALDEAVVNRAHRLGDVNNSGVVNVADYDEVRVMILSKSMKDFDDAVREFGETKAYAADVNEDGTIDVADLTSISNFIFNGGFDQSQVVAKRAARARAAAKVMSGDALTLQAVSEETTLMGKTIRLAVNLANSRDYVNYQMDVRLPEGMSLRDASLTERANGHQLSTADLGDGVCRVLADNAETAAFGNQTGAVLYLDVEVDGSYSGGQVELSNIVFSDAQGNAYRMSGLSTNAPTGISAITAATAKERLYSVGGLMVKSLKKGINIIKGEGATRKVFKK